MPDPEPRQSVADKNPTQRQVADRNISRFHRSLVAATRFAGKGNPAVIRDKLNDWLEYRKRAQDEGALDDEVRL